MTNVLDFLLPVFKAIFFAVISVNSGCIISALHTISDNKSIIVINSFCVRSWSPVDV